MAKLKEYGKIITGNTPPSSNLDYYNSNDICFVKPSDIASDVVTNITDSEYYISEEARACSRIIPAGSILVTCIGTVGKIGITQREVAFNQQINAIVPNDKVDTICLAYALQYHADKIKAIANAPVVPIINKSTFSEIDIPLPDLPTQCHITATLDKVSEGIAVCRQMLADLEVMVKARFVEMFGTTNSNVYGFRAASLSEIAVDFFAGGDKPTDCVSVKDEAHPYAVFANGYENAGLQGYSQKCRVDRPAVTVSARGTIGYCFVRQAGFTPVVRLITIVPNDEVSVEYLKYAIDNLQIKSSGTSQAQLTVPDFKREKIIVPPQGLQKQFSLFVTQVDKSKSVVQQQLAELETLKKSLMQEYFG